MDARRWRQLMNEMQMLLFRSPVNLRREARGSVTINGIWLSGLGRLPELKASGFARVQSDDMTAAGLASLAGIGNASLHEQLSPWTKGEENLMVLTDLVSPVLNADPYRWSDAVMQLDRKIEPVVQGMHGIKRGQLLIYPCNGERFRTTPGGLLRFWRAVKPLSNWVQAMQQP